MLDVGDVLDSGDDSVYWIADTVDARGQIMQETLRNQNTINRRYNRANGWLLKVESWDANLDMIQQTRYGFDTAGNVQYRERFRPWIVNPDGSFYAGDTEEVTETFAYDSLDRITGATVTRNGVPETTRTYGYGRLGNFQYKDDINNTYSYTGCMAGPRAAGPHAVCSANGTNFTYDANGNLIVSTGAKARTIDYSAFNKPVQITENGASVEFVYGADRSRIFKQATSADGVTKITWYVGLGAEGKPIYEQTATLDTNGQIVKREHLHFIYAGGYHNGQPFAVRVVEEDEDNDPSQPNFIRYDGTEYYHRDHLGSVIAVTDDHGVLADAAGDMHASLLSFDAFGKRRNADWSDTPDGVDQYSPSSRGNLDYTGHEAVSEVGLIHMNGRVYDPELGVFLSADPHIQAAEMSQNYHRYSYVLNNPIRYNDPSGYFFTFVVGAILAAAEAHIVASMVVMFMFSYAETGGDLRTALITAVSAGVAHGIGTKFAGAKAFSARFFGKALVHGLTQGIFSEALGGDFRGGFVGGFLGSVTGPIVPTDPVIGTLVSAMIGGTISELTGGKFRNGARSAAIVHLFNDLGDHGKGKGSSHNLDGECDVNMSCIGEKTIEEARLKGMKSLPYGRGVDNEWGLYIYKIGDRYIASVPIEGGPGSLPLFKDIFPTRDGYGNITGLQTVLGRHQVVEVLHTHVVGETSSNFSFGDVEYAEAYRVNVSVRFRNSIRLYDHQLNNTHKFKQGYNYNEHKGISICRGCF